MASSWDKIKTALSGVAPALGEAIGGPYATLAGKLVSSIFNTDNPDSLVEKIQNATPDELIRLKQAEYDFQLKSKELSYTLDRLEQSDKENARSREVALAQVGKHDWVQAFIACTILIGSVAVPMIFFYYPITKDMMDIARSFITSLGNAAMVIITYYFGSMYKGR